MNDGTVMVLALGQAQAVEQLGEWLHQGPPSARVEQVQVSQEQAQDWAHLADFRTA